MLTCSTSIRRTTAALVLAAATLPVASSALADEAFARQALAAMSDYLGSQKAIAFDYDAKLDIVTDDSQKLAIASSGSVAFERPDNLYATRAGGFATVELGFDGATLSILNKDANLYAQQALPGSVEDAVHTLRETYNRQLPAADLLSEDFAAILTPLITDVKDLGSGVIAGTECDHLAFRTEDFDLQIWVAQGDAPYPCRYTITDTKVAGWPEYQVDLHNWKTDDAAMADVDFSLPTDATLAEIADIPDLDDLAGIYSTEGNQ